MGGALIHSEPITTPVLLGWLAATRVWRWLQIRVLREAFESYYVANYDREELHSALPLVPTELSLVYCEILRRSSSIEPNFIHTPFESCGSRPSCHYKTCPLHTPVLADMQIPNVQYFPVMVGSEK